MLALLFATCVCGGLVALRISWTENVRYSFLLWNLFLAWLPLGFAFLAAHTWKPAPGRNLWATIFGLAWLVFFPNSPYILTDVIHLSGTLRQHYWIDFTLILTCAFTGLIVGFVSLFLMHSLVQRSSGAFKAWLFIAGVAALSGFGVYVGRFLRFNSWDLVLRPRSVFDSLTGWLADPQQHPSAYFPLLFAAFMFLSYVMLYALTHLRHVSPQFAAQTAE